MNAYSALVIIASFLSVRRIVVARTEHPTWAIRITLHAEAVRVARAAAVLDRGK
jgi:hypothetical protein